MVDAVEKHLRWPSKRTRTEVKKIHGFAEDVNWNDPLYYYGSDMPLIKSKINGDKWISESLKIYDMQVRWAVQNEMARTVEDVLARRTRALLLDAKESIRIARRVAEIIADELGKDNDWIEQQVAGYSRLAGQYLLS